MGYDLTFDEQSDAYLKEFIAFCQVGAFRVE
jgi:hypothetical protein